MFIPVFKIGAAIGRIVGEALHLYFPMGIRYGGRISQIIPGNITSFFVLLIEGKQTNIYISIQVAMLWLELLHFRAL